MAERMYSRCPLELFNGIQVPDSFNRKAVASASPSTQMSIGKISRRVFKLDVAEERIAQEMQMHG